MLCNYFFRILEQVKISFQFPFMYEFPLHPSPVPPIPLPSKKCFTYVALVTDAMVFQECRSFSTLQNASQPNTAHVGFISSPSFIVGTFRSFTTHALLFIVVLIPPPNWFARSISMQFHNWFPHQVDRLLQAWRNTLKRRHRMLGDLLKATVTSDSSLTSLRALL